MLCIRVQVAWSETCPPCPPHYEEIAHEDKVGSFCLGERKGDDVYGTIGSSSPFELRVKQVGGHTMDQSTTPSVQESMYRALCTLLTREGVSYRALHHEPTFTSADSARVRGEDVRIGGKALVMKVGEDFRLFVVSAARKVDSTAIKEYFNVKKSRFAAPDELLRMTGLVSGSIPPFGKPLLPFEVFVDPSILDNESIAFNAGSLTDSIIMPVVDYLRIARPKVFAFSSSS
jgi:Ala-tRNA(Pro) deacylase